MTKLLSVKIINKSPHPLPAYETLFAAGMDLRAHLETAVTLQPLQRAVIATGLFIELPDGYEAQIRPRSGMAARFGITVLNTPGTIDADYRGEIKIILVNLSDQTFEVQNGERIAQMVVTTYERVHWDEVASLTNSGRGDGGFGHTGK